MQPDEDLRRENVDASGQTQDRRHLEQFQVAHKTDQQNRETCRQRQPQCNAKKDLRAGSLGDATGFLERRIHRTERHDHQQKHHGGPKHGFDEDHSAHALDIQRLGENAELSDQDGIDKPLFPSQQEHPAEHLDHHRQREGQERGDVDQSTERRIRPLREPRQQ